MPLVVPYQLEPINFERHGYMHSSLKVAVSALVLAFCLGACSTLTNNIAIKDLDKLRAAQTACLATNAHQMDDRTSDPERIAREVATACNDSTERLVAHAIARPSPHERQKFEEDAEIRAAGFVKASRGSI